MNNQIKWNPPVLVRTGMTWSDGVEGRSLQLFYLKLRTFYKWTNTESNSAFVQNTVFLTNDKPQGKNKADKTIKDLQKRGCGGAKAKWENYTLQGSIS